MFPTWGKEIVVFQCDNFERWVSCGGLESEVVVVVVGAALLGAVGVARVHVHVHLVAILIGTLVVETSGNLATAVTTAKKK